VGDGRFVVADIGERKAKTEMRGKKIVEWR
jgi:hypothetical protein